MIGDNTVIVTEMLNFANEDKCFFFLLGFEQVSYCWKDMDIIFSCLLVTYAV